MSPTVSKEIPARAVRAGEGRHVTPDSVQKSADLIYRRVSADLEAGPHSNGGRSGSRTSSVLFGGQSVLRAAVNPGKISTF